MHHFFTTFDTSTAVFKERQYYDCYLVQYGKVMVVDISVNIFAC